LIPLGGLSPLQILSFQGTVLAQVLLVGGVCVALAAAMGRTLPVMACAWILMGAFSIGPWAARGWWPRHDALWIFWESISAFHVLDRQLAGIRPEPAPAATAFA